MFRTLIAILLLAITCGVPQSAQSSAIADYRDSRKGSSFF